MKTSRIIACGLALMVLFCFGCARKPDTSLGETKLAIPIYRITAPAKGKIIGLIIDKGEHIGRGQPLFAIASGDVDAKAKHAAEELAKAEAELKRLEIGSSTQVDPNELAKAREALSNTEAKVEKMNRLFAAGAVSKKQVNLATSELELARANYQALSDQSGRKLASPEAIKKQKEIVQALKQASLKTMAEQSRYEAIAPNAGVVIEKSANSGDEVEKDQTVLELLAQDECELMIELSSNAARKLENKQTTLIFKDKSSDLVFSGKLEKLEGNNMIVSVKLPTAIKQGSSVKIFVQE